MKSANRNRESSAALESNQRLFSNKFIEFSKTVEERKAILTEDIPAIKTFCKGKSLVKREFFMPQGLHKIDKSLPEDYWGQYHRLISFFCGILCSTTKQIHHVQLAP